MTASKETFRQYIRSIYKQTMSFQQYLIWLAAQQQGVAG